MRAPVLTVIILFVAAVVAYPLVRSSLLPPKPRPFVTVTSRPENIVSVWDIWCWIERPFKAPARLVRAQGAAAQTVAQADSIVGFSLGGDSLAWSSKSGAKWQVSVQTGGRTETVWEGTEQVGRPWVASGKVLWAATEAPDAKSSPALPALGPTTTLFIRESQSAPRTVARLLEQRADVVGVLGDTAYVSCLRADGPPLTVVYAVDLKQGTSRRLAAERGESQVSVGNSGELLWTAASRDSSDPQSASSVISTAPDRGETIVSDWLPRPGQLFRVGDALYYAGGNGDYLCELSMSRPGELATYHEMPRGFAAIAAGPKGVLLMDKLSASSAWRLSTIPLP